MKHNWDHWAKVAAEGNRHYSAVVAGRMGPDQADPDLATFGFVLGVTNSGWELDHPVVELYFDQWENVEHFEAAGSHSTNLAASSVFDRAPLEALCNLHTEDSLHVVGDEARHLGAYVVAQPGQLRH